MKYVITFKEQGFDFYLKSCNPGERAISIEVDPNLAKSFDTEKEAKDYIKENGLPKKHKVIPFEPATN